MLSIASNIQSLKVTNFINNINKGIETATDRISSGKRINSAADDPAGLQIATRMTSTIQGLEMASQNIRQGQSLLNVTDAGLQSGIEIVQSMRQLALESKNGTLSNEQRGALQESFSALQNQYEQTISGSELFGKNLLTASAEDIRIQSGANAGQYNTLSAVDSSSATLGIDAGSINISTVGGADSTIAQLDTALESLALNQGIVGGQANGLESRLNLVKNLGENTATSRSRIEDADLAKETSDLQLLQVQQQVALQALQMVGQMPNNALSLLR